MDTFELWTGGPVMERSDDAAPVGTDSVLLADFVRAVGAKRGLDMGCGSGVISLLLLERLPAVTMLLVDISARAAALAERNMALNGLSPRARVVTGDLRSLRREEVGQLDFIVANPPYHPVTGKKSPDAARSAARDEGLCTLRELAEASSRLLNTGGKLFMVYPAARMAEAICELARAGLEPKRLRTVQGRVDTPPSVFLVECSRGGKHGLAVEPALILKNADGSDTDEVRRIYHL